MIFLPLEKKRNGPVYMTEEIQNTNSKTEISNLNKEFLKLEEKRQ